MVKKVFKAEHVGMTVYFVSGEAGIIEEYTGADIYPVKVSFKKGETDIMRFTADGKTFLDDKVPSLSFVPWHPPEGWDEPPLPNWETDHLILVKMKEDEEWRTRYFSHWSNRKAVCFDFGKTSYTAEKDEKSEWPYYKEYKGDENGR